MDGAGSGVGQWGYPPNPIPTPGGSEKDLACHCVALTYSLCTSLPRLLWIWESLLLTLRKAGMPVPGPPGLQPLPCLPPLPHVPAPPCGCPWDCTQRL